MPKDLKVQSDVDKSLESQESGGGLTLKIPEGKTPVYFLSSAYEDGYIHWMDVPGAGRMRVVCGGGLEGKGYAPDSCKLCAFCAATYEKAKQIDLTGKKEKAQAVRNEGNDIHAKYEAQFIVAMGEMVKIKDEEGKKSVADFDDAEVGILSMTSKQYQDFTGLRGSDAYPFIKDANDLMNRPILLDKAKRDSKGKKARYATIVFIPARNQTDPPKVEWKKEDFPLVDNFKIDTEQIQKAYDALMGRGIKKSTAIADDAYEEDESVDDFVGDDDSDLGKDDTGDDDDFLSDVEGDEPVKTVSPKKEAAAPKKNPAKKGPKQAEF